MIMKLLLLFALPSVLVAQNVPMAGQDCGIDGYRCGLTEFLSLVNESTGIQLSQNNLNTACMTLNGTLDYIDSFVASCVQSTTSQDLKSINSTIDFLTEMCNTSSTIYSAIGASESCYANSSAAFVSCARNFTPPKSTGNSDDDNWRMACCQYRNLMNCAVQPVENACGATSAETLQQVITKVNGAGLEIVCSNFYSQCGSSSIMLAAPSILIFILSFVAVLKHLL